MRLAGSFGLSADFNYFLYAQFCYNYAKGKERERMPLIMPIKKLSNTSEISELAHREQEPILLQRMCIVIWL